MILLISARPTETRTRPCETRHRLRSSLVGRPGGLEVPQRRYRLPEHRLRKLRRRDHSGARYLQNSVNGALAAIDQLLAQGYEFVTVRDLLLRRGIRPEAGVMYYDAKNTGVNLDIDEAGSGYLTRAN